MDATSSVSLMDLDSRFDPSSLARDMKCFPLPDLSAFLGKPCSPPNRRRHPITSFVLPEAHAPPKKKNAEKKKSNVGSSDRKSNVGSTKKTSKSEPALRPEVAALMPLLEQHIVPKEPSEAIGQTSVGNLTDQMSVGDSLINLPLAMAKLPVSSTHDVRSSTHVDAIIQFADSDFVRNVKVLPRQRLLVSDEEPQDDLFWIELRPTAKNDQGYLHDADVDLLAQEIVGGFLLIDRRLLKEALYDSKLPADSATTALPREATYRVFRLGLKRELKTLVPAKDLLDKDALPGCLVALYYFEDTL